MKFIDRKKETLKLEKALSGNRARLIVIYGRRRCGKSTLIKQVLKKSDIYYMAHAADESIQIQQLADLIDEKVPGFAGPVYPDWMSLFKNLHNTLRDDITLAIDEFPYLVKQYGGLPGVIQNLIDNFRDRKFNLILCGSSQQMMQGLVLGTSSPLYGRADEIIRIQPLEAGWISDALNCTTEQAVEEYSVWGGVPRYLELRAEEANFREAITNLVLDRYGVLHDEPARLFLDDMRESVQPYSILSVAGGGSNRLSEIAGRLSKPATNLSRPLDTLINLGYLSREIPFGENYKNAKKTLYRIVDPFMRFWFRFLAPNLSALELGLTDQVWIKVKRDMEIYISAEWENLSRKSVPFATIRGIEFGQAYRWWGTNLNNKPMELDVVAESADSKSLLIGECKWSVNQNADLLLRELKDKAESFPLIRGRKVITALFLKKKPAKSGNTEILIPDDVMKMLR